MSESIKIYSCPKCHSREVYAAYEVHNQIYRILEAVAGCHYCNYTVRNMTRI